MASASVQHQLNLCPECDTSLGDGEMLQSHSPPLGCSQSRVEERSKVNVHYAVSARGSLTNMGYWVDSVAPMGSWGDEGGREGASKALAHTGHLAWLSAEQDVLSRDGSLSSVIAIALFLPCPGS